MMRLAVLLGLITLLQGSTAFRVVCVYTNWAQYRPDGGKFLPEDVDPTLCTHLIYVYAKLKGNKLSPVEWNDDSTKWAEGMYARVNNLKKINPDMKTLLGVGGWNMKSKEFSKLAAGRVYRRIFARSTVKFLRDRNFDGLTIDWQHPTKRGGRPGDRVNYSHLLKELRNAFDREHTKTGKPKLLLTAGVSASQRIIEDAYEVDNITKYTDFVNVLAYDFHGAWENYTGHPSQLYARNDEIGPMAEMNVDASMRYWMSHVPDREKLTLAVSSSARTFTLFDPTMNGIGDLAEGPGVAGEFTQTPGMLAYYERCFHYDNATRVWDDTSKSAYWYSGDQWVAGEDEESVKFKVHWMRYNNIGGIMLNPLDMDDYSGIFCTGDIHPLLITIHEQIYAPLPPNPYKGRETKGKNAATSASVTSMNLPTDSSANTLVEVPSHPATIIYPTPPEITTEAMPVYEGIQSVRAPQDSSQTHIVDNFAPGSKQNGYQLNQPDLIQMSRTDKNDIIAKPQNFQHDSVQSLAPGQPDFLLDEVHFQHSGTPIDQMSQFPGTDTFENPKSFAKNNSHGIKPESSISSRHMQSIRPDGIQNTIMSQSLQSDVIQKSQSPQLSSFQTFYDQHPLKQDGLQTINSELHNALQTEQTFQTNGKPPEHQSQPFPNGVNQNSQSFQRDTKHKPKPGPSESIPVRQQIQPGGIQYGQRSHSFETDTFQNAKSYPSDSIDSFNSRHSESLWTPLSVHADSLTIHQPFQQDGKQSPLSTNQSVVKQRMADGSAIINDPNMLDNTNPNMVDTHRVPVQDLIMNDLPGNTVDTAKGSPIRPVSAEVQHPVANDNRFLDQAEHAHPSSFDSVGSRKDIVNIEPAKETELRQFLKNAAHIPTHQLINGILGILSLEGQMKSRGAPEMFTLSPTTTTEKIVNKKPKSRVHAVLPASIRSTFKGPVSLFGDSEVLEQRSIERSSEPGWKDPYAEQFLRNYRQGNTRSRAK